MFAAVVAHVAVAVAHVAAVVAHVAAVVARVAAWASSDLRTCVDVLLDVCLDE